MRPKIALVFLWTFSLYAFQFFYEGGRTYVSPDGENYMAMARGDASPAPFNRRILKPLLAFLAGLIPGMSPVTAFRILTPIEVLGSLFAVLALLRKMKSPPGWQLAVLVSLGSSLAVCFGHSPVLVDTLLLLWTCLMLVSLEGGYLALGLVFGCLGALTKEYGVLLGFAWAAYAYRRGHPLTAYAGSLVSVACYFFVTWAAPRPAALQAASFLEVIRGCAVYELQILNSANFPKVFYIWLWAVLWPVLLLAALSIVRLSRADERPEARPLACALLLSALPLLLLGDWDRSMLIVVPSACIVAAAHPLARDSQFAALLAVGGISTALARPLYTSLPAPRSFILAMSVLSLLSSLLIVAKILRSSLGTRAAIWSRS